MNAIGVASPARGLKAFVLTRMLRGKARKPVTYIVPTPLGMAYLAGNVGLFVAAALYRNDVLYVHGFSLLSLFFLAMIQTHGNVRRVECAPSPLADPFAGREFSLVCQLRNPARAGATLLRVRVIPHDGNGIGAGASVPKKTPVARIERKTRYVLLEYTGGHSTSPVRLTFEARERGRFPRLRAFVSTRYPFGLFLAWRVFDLDYDACVTPAPVGHLPLPLGAVDEGEDASARARRRSGPEPEEPRPFRFGDPASRVLWRRYVPGSVPLVRQVDDEGGKTVRLSWAATAHAGGLEARLSQMTVWILDCRGKSHACAIEFPGFATRERDEAAFEPALRALALFPRPSEEEQGNTRAGTEVI